MKKKKNREIQRFFKPDSFTPEQGRNAIKEVIIRDLKKQSKKWRRKQLCSNSPFLKKGRKIPQSKRERLQKFRSIRDRFGSALSLRNHNLNNELYFAYPSQHETIDVINRVASNP